MPFLNTVFSLETIDGSSAYKSVSKSFEVLPNLDTCNAHATADGPVRARASVLVLSRIRGAKALAEDRTPLAPKQRTVDTSRAGTGRVSAWLRIQAQRLVLGGSRPESG